VVHFVVLAGGGFPRGEPSASCPSQIQVLHTFCERHKGGGSFRRGKGRERTAWLGGRLLNQRRRDKLAPASREMWVKIELRRRTQGSTFGGVEVRAADTVSRGGRIKGG